MTLKDLRTWFSANELLVLVLFASIVSLRMVYREETADQGVLHCPLRVGIAQWPGYAGGIIADHGESATSDSIFWRGQGTDKGTTEAEQLLVEFRVVEN